MITNICLFFIRADFVSNRDSTGSILIPKFTKTTERKFTLFQITDIAETNLMMWDWCFFCVCVLVCVCSLAFPF